MLLEMHQRQASDLHVRVGVKPRLRIDGVLIPLDCESITAEEMDTILSQLLNDKQMERFLKKNELDLALSVMKLGRYRINIYRQRGTVGIAVRAVNDQVPNFEELNLPPILKKIAEERRGLVVVTGVTGSGKSTNLASMIEYMNEKRTDNIITIEDPIEYVYRDKGCIISQREIGSDTEGFSSALRHAFRQDPDVIMIGEIRDLETMSIALTAADTGHLVLTTLHTLNVVETISRIVNFFPPHQHQQVRLLLAGTLKAIVCQRLLKRSDIQGRYPACEVMISTGALKECILDETRTSDIIELVEGGRTQYGMQSFDQSIMEAYRRGVISFEEAMTQATNPDDFDLRVKGITGASDRWGGDSKTADAHKSPESQGFSKY